MENGWLISTGGKHNAVFEKQNLDPEKWNNLHKLPHKSIFVFLLVVLSIEIVKPKANNIPVQVRISVPYDNLSG